MAYGLKEQYNQMKREGRCPYDSFEEYVESVVYAAVDVEPRPAIKMCNNLHDVFIRLYGAAGAAADCISYSILKEELNPAYSLLHSAAIAVDEGEITDEEAISILLVNIRLAYKIINEKREWDCPALRAKVLLKDALESSIPICDTVSIP